MLELPFPPGRLFSPLCVVVTKFPCGTLFRTRALSKPWVITLPQTVASWLTTFGISLKVSQKLVLRVHAVFLCLASFSASVSQPRPQFSWDPSPKCIYLEGSPANLSGTHLIWLRYSLPAWSWWYTWMSTSAEMLVLMLCTATVQWLVKWTSLPC